MAAISLFFTAIGFAKKSVAVPYVSNWSLLLVVAITTGIVSNTLSAHYPDLGATAVLLSVAGLRS